MEKCWFNLMLSNKKLEHRCGLSKSMDNLDALGHTSGSEEPILNDVEKKIPSWGNNLISDDTFLVRNSNGDSYSVYFDIENQIFDIDNASYLNSGSYSSNYYSYYSMYDTQSNWNNHINSCIDAYLRFEISLNNYIDSYINSLICTESINSIEDYSIEDSSIEDPSIEDSSIEDPSIEDSSIEDSSIEDSSIEDHSIEDYSIEDYSIEDYSIEDYSIEDYSIEMNNSSFDINTKYKKLWVQCENCYELNYKKFFSSKMNICEHCGYHLNMSSSDRIELFIDPGTWESMDDDMVSIDPIEFDSEEDSYIDRIDYYQRETGLTEAVRTGIGQLNSIPIAMGVMDFQFMGGSMGSVVGEKITRLIEYATNRSLPVIIVCASGGARMQEGSLSLMQMAKISSASYDYQSNKKLFYVSILTSPTTGGVTASFGMLGDIIIAEPNAYIAFAGKRVIEQTLKKTVPDGLQVTEYLFQKGLFDPIVPRNPLKSVLNELFQLHGFLPLNKEV